MKPARLACRVNQRATANGGAVNPDPTNLQNNEFWD
jgi:hypothetical protein